MVQVVGSYTAGLKSKPERARKGDVMTTTTKKITYACGHNGDRRLQDGPTQDRLFDQFRAGLCPDCVQYASPEGFGVLRRRIEDALRKTATTGDLIKIARMLNVII